MRVDAMSWDEKAAERVLAEETEHLSGTPALQVGLIWHLSRVILVLVWTTATWT